MKTRMKSWIILSLGVCLCAAVGCISTSQHMPICGMYTNIDAPPAAVASGSTLLVPNAGPIIANACQITFAAKPIDVQTLNPQAAVSPNVAANGNQYQAGDGTQGGGTNPNEQNADGGAKNSENNKGDPESTEQQQNAGTASK